MTPLLAWVENEFVVLLDEVATREAALTIARRLAETLRAPYEIGTDRRITMASIGVAVGPESFETADAVVAAADAAMYDAKRHSPGRCVAYSKDRHGQAGLPLWAMMTSPTWIKADLSRSTVADVHNHA